MFGIIYKITNKINGKSYIGQTTLILEERMTKHFSKNSGCPIMEKAIKKYGKDNFDIEILGTFLEELLDLAEIAAIKEYGTLSPNGYNLTEGGGRGGKLSKETRLKMSLIVKERYRDKTKHPFFGKHHSKKAKEKISKANLGKKMSFEARQKSSIAKIGEKNPSYGKPLSELTKRKLSIAKSGKKHYLFGGHLSEETKKKISETKKKANAALKRAVN